MTWLYLARFLDTADKFAEVATILITLYMRVKHSAHDINKKPVQQHKPQRIKICQHSHYYAPPEYISGYHSCSIQCYDAVN